MNPRMWIKLRTLRACGERVRTFGGLLERGCADRVVAEHLETKKQELTLILWRAVYALETISERRSPALQ